MTMVITNAKIVLEDETILGNIKIVDDTIAQISWMPKDVLSCQESWTCTHMGLEDSTSWTERSLT